MFCSARRCSHTVLQLPPEENKHTETMSPFIIPLPFPHQPSFLILLTPFSNHSLLTSFSSILHLRFAHFSSFLFLPNQKPASHFFSSLFPPFPLLQGHCDNLIREPVAAALAASKVRESQKHTHRQAHTHACVYVHVCLCVRACVDRMPAGLRCSKLS